MNVAARTIQICGQDSGAGTTTIRSTSVLHLHKMIQIITHFPSDRSICFSEAKWKPCRLALSTNCYLPNASRIHLLHVGAARSSYRLPADTVYGVSRGDQAAEFLHFLLSWTLD